MIEGGVSELKINNTYTYFFLFLTIIQQSNHGWNSRSLKSFCVSKRSIHRCLKWHTLESLINYHDYLLFWSINREKQPENLWLLYDENKAHVNANAEWNYQNSDGCSDLRAH